jgi:hypothetical protein
MTLFFCKFSRSSPTSPVNSPFNSSKTYSLFGCASVLSPVEAPEAKVIIAVWLRSLVCKNFEPRLGLVDISYVHRKI